MPTHDANAPVIAYSAEQSQASIVCPHPLTPPPETDGHRQTENTHWSQLSAASGNHTMAPAVNGNTAAAMSMMQDESLYPDAHTADENMEVDVADGKDKMDVIREDDQTNAKAPAQPESDIPPSTEPDQSSMIPDTPLSVVDVAESGCHGFISPVENGPFHGGPRAETHGATQPTAAPPSSPMLRRTTSPSRSAGDSTQARGVPIIDRELDYSAGTPPWDFSQKRIRPQYPSCTLQAYAKFKGTQQSDRQVYNVEVTVLTVDVEQATLSGYLQICGLTPDHPTLTTFFTGEIIGGPDQKYSFRTSDPAWGASDKTDLTHWARFPAWRPLSSQAKRNINFAFPLDHGNWWQQEHIFMRWKEHFLVPDYKLKSIQGASFEGFYYICFNQVEGRVSGIYFHSKSEK